MAMAPFSSGNARAKVCHPNPVLYAVPHRGLGGRPGNSGSFGAACDALPGKLAPAAARSTAAADSGDAAK